MSKAVRILQDVDCRGTHLARGECVPASGLSREQLADLVGLGFGIVVEVQDQPKVEEQPIETASASPAAEQAVPTIKRSKRQKA